MADPAAGDGSAGSQLAGRRVLVCGLGIAGRSAVGALLRRGAEVLVTTDSVAAGGFAMSTPVGPVTQVPAGVNLVVASPGYRPTHPVLVDAVARGVPVWGEVELAWRLRGPRAAPWLAITGTNGKTTTVHLLEAMLRAGGLRAVAVGNVGEPLIDAVDAGNTYDVLAVELSSQQLHFAPSIRPHAGVLLNLAADHLDWHGSMSAYAAAKRAVWSGGVAIGNLDDPLVAAALPAGGVGFTLGAPAAGQLGIDADRLVSRAFGDDGAPLLDVADVRPAGRHNVANALAAAALALAFAVTPAAIAAGLRAFVPDPHRNALVLERDRIAWVDDSKATNPHAAQASLTSYDRVVWIAGGQLKGVDPDALVAGVTGRLAGAVLLGQDRAVLAAALARHAPDVPVIVVDTVDDGAMVEVVRAAAGLARPGDTVLLAPAAASYDMFADYGARGDAFAAAARALGTGARDVR